MLVNDLHDVADVLNVPATNDLRLQIDQLGSTTGNKLFVSNIAVERYLGKVSKDFGDYLTAKSLLSHAAIWFNSL